MQVKQDETQVYAIRKNNASKRGRGTRTRIEREREMDKRAREGMKNE